MPDRVIGRAATVYADLPGYDTEEVSVAVRDSIGTATPGSATAVGGGRYQYTLPAPARGGRWEIDWIAPDETVILTQPFTVGPAPAAPITKYALRFQVANRVSGAFEGRVQVADSTSIGDELLIGGAANFRYYYVILDPKHPETGIVYRVQSYNGSSLQLTGALTVVPTTGQRYLLTEIAPDEIDDAIEAAIGEISLAARILETVHGVPVADGTFTVPPGMRYVTRIFTADAEVEQKYITMRPERKVKLGGTHADATSVTVCGVRAQTPLVWEDSTLDIEPGVIIARACQLLHAARAAGAGVDVEEHLRRQLTAQDEFDRLLKRTSGRLPSGALAVIE